MKILSNTRGLHNRPPAGDQAQVINSRQWPGWAGLDRMSWRAGIGDPPVHTEQITLMRLSGAAIRGASRSRPMLRWGRDEVQRGMCG